MGCHFEALDVHRCGLHHQAQEQQDRSELGDQKVAGPICPWSARLLRLVPIAPRISLPLVMSENQS